MSPVERSSTAWTNRSNRYRLYSQRQSARPTTCDSSYFGLRRLDAAFQLPLATSEKKARDAWASTAASSRRQSKRRQAAAVQKKMKKERCPHPALFIRLDPRRFYLEDKLCLEWNMV